MTTLLTSCCCWWYQQRKQSRKQHIIIVIIHLYLPLLVANKPKRREVQLQTQPVRCRIVLASQQDWWPSVCQGRLAATRTRCELSVVSGTRRRRFAPSGSWMHNENTFVSEIAQKMTRSVTVNSKTTEERNAASRRYCAILKNRRLMLTWQNPILRWNRMT